MIKSESLAEQYVQMAQAIHRVRELHKEVDGNISLCGDPTCCGEYDEGYTVCSHCESDYPCLTITELDGDQNDAG